MAWIYGPGAGKYGGQPVDLDRCRETVSDRAPWPNYSQCSRKAITEPDENGYRFCRQHDPVAIKAREDARATKWRQLRVAEQQKRDTTRLALEALEWRKQVEPLLPKVLCLLDTIHKYVAEALTYPSYEQYEALVASLYALRQNTPLKREELWPYQEDYEKEEV